MKKNGFIKSLLILVPVVVLLSFLGFGTISLVGLVIILFFGLGSLVAGIILMFKPAEKMKLFTSILLILFSPFFIWFGYTMLASDFYTTTFPLLNDATRIIFNPDGSLVGGVIIMSGGFLGLYLALNKPKNIRDKKFAPVLAICGILSMALGGYSLYQHFSAPSQTSNSSMIVDKYIRVNMVTGKIYTFETYYTSIIIDGNIKDFLVSRQIYNIFNTGDKVSITYKQSNLKSITISR